MSNAVETKSSKSNPAKQYPWYAIPATLTIIMVGSGVFVLLLANAIAIFSTI